MTAQYSDLFRNCGAVYPKMAPEFAKEGGKAFYHWLEMRAEQRRVTSEFVR